ncbi:WxcM-like domain-containing protein [Candidatus Pelagibacter sp. HIMB1587]|uniref:WxcM-like domain-containing protein n=1 Tax=Candidatus Pelagibacter sp. HIMB1587 TaxID=3413354 RepID=UPI003F854299
MISGIKITPLKQIKDNRGKIMHMLRSDSSVFQAFGEIYFSTVNPKVIKAWHLHKEATLNYVCIKGKVELALYDDRKNSETKGVYQKIFLSPDDYFLVTIPPYIWNGFKGLYKEESIIANCLNQPHDENEMVRKEPFDSYFKYIWDK